MQTESDHLFRLLRCEMTAVNQQFTHILALRSWGHRDVADRIAEVDDIDFPNAMKIIQFIVEKGITTVALDCEAFLPGHDLGSVLAAEQRMEYRFDSVIAECSFTDNRLKDLLATAAMPRSDYVSWLEQMCLEHPPATEIHDPFATETAALTGMLFTVMEQSLIHSFVHRHNGNPEFADAAWHTSGAAMMQLTRLVALYSAEQSAIVFGDMPSMLIQGETDGALEADGSLAAHCAALASQAASNTSHPRIRRFCDNTANYYSALSDFRGHTPHPAEHSNPPVFHSFSATWEKFVSP